MNLREVRRLRKLTQARLSKKLKIGQEGVSRIEKRTDLYLSTLRSYVEGRGRQVVADGRVSRPAAGNSGWIRRRRSNEQKKRKRRPEQRPNPRPKRAALREDTGLRRSPTKFYKFKQNKDLFLSSRLAETPLNG